MPKPKPGLQRSRDQRIVLGVCGGFAEWLGWRPWVIRLLMLVAMCPGGVPGLLIYVILAIVMPLRDA